MGLGLEISDKTYNSRLDPPLLPPLLFTFSSLPIFLFYEILNQLIRNTSDPMGFPLKDTEML